MRKTMRSEGAHAVASWVLIGVGMLLIQVILGGITRLTGSGLSITQWDVLTGSVPPLHASQWTAEFQQYRQTPQYRLLHADFTLADFKFIFFWEWLHRFWARMVAVVFIVGFVYLLWKKKMSRDMIRPLILLFLLGALQGAVGWIMVASGLTGDAIYVAPTRLAIHFVLALGLICYAFWFALQLTVPPESLVGCSRLRKWTWAILATVFFQLLFGALMAGHQAALAAPTWPTINGDWVPSSLFAKSPLYLNFINNPLTIHFVHRGLAYVILAQTLCWTWAACSRNNPSWDPFRRYRTMPLILVSAQVLLGISTVLSGARIVANHWGAFEWLALLHQVTGMLFLLCMVGALFMVRTDRPGSPV